MSSPETEQMTLPVNILDHNGNQIHLTWSSLAEQPALRIYTTDKAEGQVTCQHLTVKQATLLRDAINLWLTQAEKGESA